MNKAASSLRLFAALLLSAGLFSHNAIGQNDLYFTEWGDFFAGSGTLKKANLMTKAVTTIVSNLNIPSGVARDGHGNLYVSDTGNGKIFKFTFDGTQTTFAAGLNNPSNLYLDPFGDAIVPNFGDGTVIRIALDGTRSTIASGLPGPVSIRSSQQMWSASLGLYVVSRGFSPGRVDYFLRNPDETWTQTPIATTLGLTYDAVPDQAGNLFVSEYGSSRILKFPVSSGGMVSTNPVVFAKGLSPVGLAFDGGGDLYEADLAGMIRKFVYTNGTLSTNPVVVLTNLHAPADIDFPSPPFLRIRRAGDTVALTWPDPSFVLQTAGAIPSTFSDVPGATSPYTNTSTSGARFFQLESR